MSINSRCTLCRRYLVEFCLPEDEVCDDVSTSIDSGFLDDDTRSLDEGETPLSCVPSHFVFSW